MSKRKSTSGSEGLPKKPRSERFFKKEVLHLMKHQEDREEMLTRARRLIGLFQTPKPKENNVADYIMNELDGFGEYGSHSDYLIVTFKEELADESRFRGPFLKWYQKWTINLTRGDDNLLWCEEDDWIVFMAIARFLTLTGPIKLAAENLLRGLDENGDEDEESGQVDLHKEVREFLQLFDNDPFLDEFKID